MKTYHVLYNAKANNGRGEEAVEALKTLLPHAELKPADVTAIKDYAAFFAAADPADGVILCGGDGTLNRFVNDVGDLPGEREVLFYSVGTGNDFLRDIGGTPGEAPVDIRPYIRRLPTVTVKGITCKFINGIGYGIDGYCCEVGDKMRAAGDQKINYAGIAVKGLLFHYKPTAAVITVDGKEYRFKKVWLAPTMNGRYYGGGMMATPDQDRLHNDTLSTLVMHGSGKLKTLTVFPSIFKGEHVKHKEMVEVLTGRTVKVVFDRPTPLQIDGETVLGVTEYVATAPER